MNEEKISRKDAKAQRKEEKPKPSKRIETIWGTDRIQVGNFATNLSLFPLSYL
jgi:hypothetical protein